MPKIKFADIKGKIVNNRGFNSLEEIKKAGLRIVKPSKYKKGDKDYKLFLIEEKYLKPFLFSIKETKTIKVNLKNLKRKVFYCKEKKKNLQGTFAYEFIKWGKEKNFHKRPSCNGRKEWFFLPVQDKVDFISNRFVGDRFLIVEGGNFLVSDVLFIGSFRNSAYKNKEIAFLNSTLFNLFLEVSGRKTYAIGVMYIYGPEIRGAYTMTPEFLPDKLNEIYISFRDRPIHSIFTELGFDKDKPIRSQEPHLLPDRAALDKIVFDALSLTEEERKEVYWSVAELAKNRLDKAKSLKKK